MAQTFALLLPTEITARGKSAKISFVVGMLRVITRPEFDPTRSKEGKMPDPYPTRNFDKSI